MQGVSCLHPPRKPEDLTLADRETQFRALRLALTECASGTVKLLVAEGGMGCGKSTFLGEALRTAAASGFAVLRAAGLPADHRQPLGVLQQLLNDPALPGATRTAVRPMPVHHVRGALERLAAGAPLAIGIDDVQDADPESLHCLMHLTRHSPTSRILLLCTALACSPAADPVLEAELMRQTAFERITLDCLSLDGVTGLVSDRGMRLTAPPPADYCLTVTGGNPLLLRALLEEHSESDAPSAPRPVEPSAPHSPPQAAPPRPVVGGRFYQSVLACLSRTEAAIRQTAGALAVLGGAARADLLPQLLGASPASVTRGLRALEATGLTTSGRFRHPVAEAAALDALDPSRRAHLHRRAAALLHHDGAAPRDVARHLLAARHAAGPWAVSVLRDAAEQSLAQDDVASAVSCLELAYGACVRERERPEIRIRLAAAFGRTNIAVAEEHLADLVATLREGELTVHQTALLVPLLVNHGRLGEAREAMDRLSVADDARGLCADGAFPMAAPWPSTAHPAARRDPGTRRDLADKPFLPRQSGTPQARPEDARGQQPTAALWALPGNGTSESAAHAAEQVLQSSPLTDSTLVLLANAVRILARTGRYDTADIWCHRLLGEATRRRCPGWQAHLLAVRAELSLCRGLLADAKECAQRALAHVPGHSRSVFAGGPLACQVLACTAMGRYDEATQLLNHPVPEALFHSVYGLGYLRARGHFHLAMNRLPAAVRDFLSAGRVAREWGLDHPVLLPWRTDAAEAFLRLGETKRADQLLTEQLVSPYSGNPYVRGTALRLRAQTAAPVERLRLLSEAVSDLQSSGDRLALARALADLGAAYHSRNEPVRASATVRRAWQLAKECGAQALCDSILPSRGTKDRGPDGRAAATEALLSESEMRVATLAAGGNTNREIAGRLCVTVSTVEQHLTRVYRKLNITRRRELPTRLRHLADQTN
ncbi:AAA family ATPase [Streptomyces avermitilis]|uniref:AAA family ATPase n=1 Tax=Streptomyces avermitilis TaxID=33903 RepID=UPI003717042E